MTGHEQGCGNEMDGYWVVSDLECKEIITRRAEEDSVSVKEVSRLRTLLPRLCVPAWDCELSLCVQIHILQHASTF
jgi:hypothetical protein